MIETVFLVSGLIVAALAGYLYIQDGEVAMFALASLVFLVTLFHYSDMKRVVPQATEPHAVVYYTSPASSKTARIETGMRYVSGTEVKFRKPLDVADYQYSDPIGNYDASKNRTKYWTPEKNRLTSSFLLLGLLNEKHSL